MQVILYTTFKVLTVCCVLAGLIYRLQNPVQGKLDPWGLLMAFGLLFASLAFTVQDL